MASQMTKLKLGHKEPSWGLKPSNTFNNETNSDSNHKHSLVNPAPGTSHPDFNTHNAYKEMKNLRKTINPLRAHAATGSASSG